MGSGYGKVDWFIALVALLGLFGICLLIGSVVHAAVETEQWKQWCVSAGGHVIKRPLTCISSDGRILG